MKWFKFAISAVIAVAAITVIVLSTINIKKSLETETVKIIPMFEITYDDRDASKYYYFYENSPYSEIYEYIENGFIITNVYTIASVYIIEEIIYYIDIPIFTTYLDGSKIVFIDNNSITYELNEVGLNFDTDFRYFYIDGYPADGLYCIELTLTKYNNNVLINTLLLFVPTIFITGILSYFYKLNKKED